MASIIDAHLRVKSSSGRVSPVDKQSMGENGVIQVISSSENLLIVN